MLHGEGGLGFGWRLLGGLVAWAAGPQVIARVAALPNSDLFEGVDKLHDLKASERCKERKAKQTNKTKQKQDKTQQSNPK